MKKRLIDADKIANSIASYLAENAYLNDTAQSALEMVAKWVNEAPTVDAKEVKHGEWDGVADGYADGELVYDVWYCSECNYCIDDGTDDPALLPNYCPHCGAKMDGGSHETD